MNTQLKYIGLFIFGFLVATLTGAQNTATIGSEALNNKAVLTLVTPTGDQGFILPMVENKDNINPSPSEKGMLVYENESSRVYLWDGASWLDITTAAGGATSALNDLTDVNAASPTEGQVLQFQPGVGWVASDLLLEDTDNQSLLFADEILTIEGSEGSIDLSVYRQNISFNEETNELSITDGNTIILPSGTEDADSDPTNELQDISLSGTEISITDGSTIDLAPIIPSEGSDDQTAAEVVYNNVTSGLVAADVQTALDELAASPGGSLWSVNSDTIFYNKGHVGIGLDGPSGMLHVAVPTSNSTTNKALVVENNYSGSSASYGADIRANGTSAGAKIASFLEVENGDGVKAGQLINVDQQSEAPVYGQFVQLVSNNGSQNSVGSYLVNVGDGTGDKYGLFAGLSGENSKNTGAYSYIEGGTALGFHSSILNNTGNSTGVLSEISQNTSVLSRGFHSIISEGGEKIGFDSEIVQDHETLNTYGIRSNIVNNNSEVEQYGIHSTILGAGIGDRYGIWSNLRQGTGQKTGIYSTVRQGGDKPSYGVYSNVIHHSTSSGYAFYSNIVGSNALNGFYNSMLTSRGTLTGMENELENTGSGHSIGNTTSIYGSGTGDKTSFSSRIVEGDGPKIGYTSSIIQNSPRTTYGFESTITDNSNGGSVGLRLRVVDNVSAGVAYGILSSGDSLNTFDGSIRVGHQLSAPIVKAGSWHFMNDGANPPNLGVYSASGLRGFFSVNDGDYYNISDRQLKTNIHEMGEVIASVMQLKPSRYQFKDSNSDNQKSIGFIAQEVKVVFPELVKVTKDEDNKELHTLNYSGFGVLAIKAIQEQQEVISNQEERIEALEEQVRLLIKKIENQR